MADANPVEISYDENHRSLEAFKLEESNSIF